MRWARPSTRRRRCSGWAFPGGPAVERAALAGDPRRFPLPRPLQGQPGCHFSFSGLKTALRQTIERLGPRALEPPALHDLCASFQAAAGDILVERTAHAAALFRARWPTGNTLVVAGGVAANRELGRRLGALAAAQGLRLVVPPPALCTDNGVMIAWAGLERLRRGLIDDLAAPARARWPLDPAAEPAPGAGVKA